MLLLFPFLESLDLQPKWIVPFKGDPNLGCANSEPLSKTKDCTKERGLRRSCPSLPMARSFTQALRQKR